MNTTLKRTELAWTLNVVKRAARLSLGFVWIYEGVVPKILFIAAHPGQIELVRHSGLFWDSPETTLLVLGIAQALMGVVLVIGWVERAAVLVATAAMGVLIVLVASGNPGMLTEPYGALIKDLCLIACALTVWMLAPICAELRTGDSDGPSEPR